GCWALHLPEEYREIFIAALGQLLTLEQAAALHRHGPVSEGMPGNGRGDLALRSSDELFVGEKGRTRLRPLTYRGRGPAPCTRCYVIRGAEVVKSFLRRLALLLALITGFACAGGLPAAIVTCDDIGELRDG